MIFGSDPEIENNYKMRCCKILLPAFLILLISFSPSCKKYLNVVPDNIATIDQAFHLRDQAEKYLFTCYSYLPSFNSFPNNIGLTGSDELTIPYPEQSFGANNIATRIARGEQNVVNPLLDFWEGRNSGKPYFQSIRNCNTFLDNIGRVPDISPSERIRWIAEVKFLKAYFLYTLVRMYGPVPIIERNLPISSSIEEVKVFRDPVDSAFNYAALLIDEAIEGLPDEVNAAELGRITQPIALSVKAEMLVTAASPLYNGNPDYAAFTNGRGEHLFSTENDPAKWKKAVAACKAAIEACERAGMSLYTYQNNRYTLSDSTILSQHIIGAVTEKWNSEVIWADSRNWAAGGAAGIQSFAFARVMPYSGSDESATIYSYLSAPLHIAEMFYSKNGVPIEEDNSYHYADRLATKTATPADKYYMRAGAVTAMLNFDREPRFYGSLGFDGGLWYGIGKFDDNASNMWYVAGKAGQLSGKTLPTRYNITGYWPKKLVNINASIANTKLQTSYVAYPWPIMRLADIYLLYAEALNERDGPTAEAYKWIDLVRERSGLKGVVESWSLYSNHPGAPTTKDGLRKIIQRERLIELAFEGKRFWDLRRWKLAAEYLNRPVQGWNYLGSDDASYYRLYTIYQSQFTLKDYFWPISETELTRNGNLVQNPGW